MPRTVRALAALCLLLAAALAAPPRAGAGAAPPALEPPGTGAFPAVERALARLATHQRLLVVGAHPDDEDTQLLTLVARGRGGEAAYLSLSRGEGGQNLIGPELGVELGILRSRELLAARSIDGGRQFFTRAYDFGYTRSLEETFARWPREVLLEDVVRVVRRFKPQVVVSVFRGTPHPNHGQHQAAGVMAHEGYRAAGDPAAVPQLLAEGLPPWRPQALYRSTGFDREATTLTLETGVIDWLTGRSIFQLAMASRSEHRSQDMGRLLDLGARQARVAWVEGGEGAAAKDLFAGVDTRLQGIAAGIADAARRERVAAHLEAAEEAAASARAALHPARLAAAVPGLAAALGHLRAASAELEGQGAGDAERQAAELIAEKAAIAESGLAAAAGIAVEAAAARETVTAGEELKVQAALWNSGGEPLAAVGVGLVPAAEWQIEPVSGGTKPVAAGELATWDLAVPVPAGAEPTLPYFLRAPLRDALYDWSGAPAAVRGEPFEPPPLVARFDFAIAGQPVTLEREVVYRVGDQARGEIRRPLRVVPAMEVSVEPALILWPIDRRAPRTVEVTLVSRTATPLAGEIGARPEPVPGPPAPGWPPVPPRPFTLAPGERQTVALELAPPAQLAPGRSAYAVEAVLADGRRFAAALPLVEHEHVPPTPTLRPARVEISAAELALPRLERVGYVRGASDRVPEYLRAVGLPLELLSAETLASGDLGRYDAIVVGSRAYETEPALARANARLLDYVRRGGLLVVQYQQYAFVEGKYAPHPLEIARPHDRVTDETAPVTPLVPDHPVFTTPNRLGPADWEGWVQERGLYFANSWDPAYTPLLAMADPGGPELRGGLLAAPLGEGTYVYTGLAFFRQIPAGVPGAYRLLANLLALADRAGAGR
jgi:LmbE family N-acetylglucosaminyl deacetylase